MNRVQLIRFLRENAEQYGEENYPTYDQEMEFHLRNINSRRDVNLPKILPSDEVELLRLLRKFFNDDVSLISFVLHRQIPEKYFFYRISKLEPEIFSGLEFLGETEQDFALGLDGIGKGADAFQRYEHFNEFLNRLATGLWPEIENRDVLQSRINQFLYWGLAQLFSERREDRRCWIMATSQDYWKTLDEYELVHWSGRKEMCEGDLVFVYRTAPRKAITDIFKLQDDPYFDPVAPWHGFWVDMTSRPLKNPDFAANWA